MTTARGVTTAACGGSAAEPARQGFGLRVAAPAAFVAMWSAGFTFSSLGIRYTDPLTFLVLRYSAVLLILIPIFAVLRPAFPRGMALVHQAVQGVLLQTLYFAPLFYAFMLGLSAGVSALIISLQPILVALLAPSITGERVTWRQWSGLICGLVGVTIVIIARSGGETVSVATLALAGLSLAAMTASALYEKRFGTRQHPVSANLVQYSAGLLTTAPFALLLSSMAVEWTWQLGMSLTYLVVCNSLIAVTLLFAMVRAGAVSRVSALFFLVPPLAALIAWLVLGETLPPLAWPGVALAAVGVLLAIRK